MADAPVRSEQRTDYLGTYTVYVFADGHEETDPEGRPISKEDAQRLRLAEVASTKAKEALSARKTRRDMGDETPAILMGANLQTSAGQLLNAEFGATVRSLAQLATTVKSQTGAIDYLVNTVDLGG